MENSENYAARENREIEIDGSIFIVDSVYQGDKSLNELLISMIKSKAADQI